MGGHEHRDWVQRARDVPIEKEIERRGFKLRREGLERVGACPKCGGEDRFAINTKKQVFNCRICGIGGDVIQLVEHLDGVDFTTACTTLTGQPPPKANGKANGKHADASKKIVTASFEYQNADGTTAFVVDRIQFQKADGSFVLKDGKPDKVFRQRQPDPDHPGRFLNNVSGAPVVPYKLPSVIEAIGNDHPISIAEGEAKVNLLWSWGVAATCNAGGSKKWKPEHSEFLRGADVVILPDRDNAGWEHANVVGASLVGVAKRVRVFVLPQTKAKSDIVDWAEAGGTRERFDLLLAEARDWQPPAENADAADPEKAEAKKLEDELLDALAKAEGLDYVRKRKEARKHLFKDISNSDIDKAVQQRREKTTPLYRHWTVEPWPEPVDTDALLRDIIWRLRRHVVCSHDDLLATALWGMFAWAHGSATHSPMLVITSAEPMSGKTTMLAALSFLVPRSIRSVEMTEAALYRSIEIWHPTFVIDEFDSVLANDDKQALRSVINSGHVRGDGVLRVNKDTNRPEVFETFGPKAIGMVGRKLPAATLTRCIFVELKRRKRDEQIEKFKFEDDSHLSDLRRRLCRWSTDSLAALRIAKPAIPGELENRYDDNWRMLFAIADLAGGDWGDQARVTAIKLERSSDNTTAGAPLLIATKAILEDTDGDIGSQALIDKLTAEPDSEWAEWRNGKPITQAQLARLLKPFKIFAGPVRVGGQQVRGYRRSQFEDAWERYL